MYLWVTHLCVCVVQSIIGVCALEPGWCILMVVCTKAASARWCSQHPRLSQALMWVRSYDSHIIFTGYLHTYHKSQGRLLKSEWPIQHLNMRVTMAALKAKRCWRSEQREIERSCCYMCTICINIQEVPVSWLPVSGLKWKESLSILARLQM